LVIDVCDRVPQIGYDAAYVKQMMQDKLIEHRLYITEHGEDMPEIRDWKWEDIGVSTNTDAEQKTFTESLDTPHS
jgi:xylulose-5-phosphate/fructose-6-phosphate phosphoketolase